MLCCWTGIFYFYLKTCRSRLQLPENLLKLQAQIFWAQTLLQYILSKRNFFVSLELTKFFAPISVCWILVRGFVNTRFNFSRYSSICKCCSDFIAVIFKEVETLCFVGIHWVVCSEKCLKFSGFWGGFREYLISNGKTQFCLWSYPDFVAIHTNKARTLCFIGSTK